MPKCELHVHIEGATDAETFYKLAEKNNVTLPVNSLQEWKDFFDFSNFDHFIEVYIAAASTLLKPEDYTYLIEAFYKHQANENILYTEAFLSASFMVERFSNDEILNAIKKGMEIGEKKYQVEVQFIPDIARNFPETKGRVLNLVIEGFKKDIFIGLGLGGLENGFPPELFTETYKKAKKEGLRIVAHAGETDGAKSIWGALLKLNTERIGHGIRCLDDEKLVKYLADKQIPIEVSPGSNYCLSLVEPEENHPIRQMVDSGLLCTVNSDDPAMFSTSLTNEYLRLASQGFSFEELWQLNINAIKTSFLSPEAKHKYLKIFEEFKANNFE